uniref:Serine aminopeptidase S33 domain-containing protein n=1 Tax=Chromera velia CCMP2878 TaxID=1169474 RepID=A0A0G4IBW4_9ALVE|eukprot:Cvel_12883.t1-p1 / transcript=Cvel_12883.t1 / gene=Cvel_12883 / organism=Chromera_velia_CCMP2878 / gene_product=Lysophospholipase L2, putative / transcript_product=Lysophospholipase L2, putative / location=Cvel_scaffold860:43247-49180(-) / protein_length=608 / sequence_SO=supercontig / SO=protein_coding / is_pseudo=false
MISVGFGCAFPWLFASSVRGASWESLKDCEGRLKSLTPEEYADEMRTRVSERYVKTRGRHVKDRIRTMKFPSEVFGQKNGAPSLPLLPPSAGPRLSSYRHPVLLIRERHFDRAVSPKGAKRLKRRIESARTWMVSMAQYGEFEGCRPSLISSSSTSSSAASSNTETETDTELKEEEKEEAKMLDSPRPNTGTIKCSDEPVRIAYMIFPQYDSTSGRLKEGVVLCPGWGESSVKYAETIRDLYDRGFSVYTLDHRSQGLSGRERVDFAQSTQVTNFCDYVEDLHRFVKSVVEKVPLNNPRFQTFRPRQCLGRALQSFTGKEKERGDAKKKRKSRSRGPRTHSQQIREREAADLFSDVDEEEEEKEEGEDEGAAHRPSLCLLAHSMGGLIGCAAQLKSLYPALDSEHPFRGLPSSDDLFHPPTESSDPSTTTGKERRRRRRPLFSRIVLTGPLLDLRNPKFPSWLVRWVAFRHVSRGAGPLCLFGESRQEGPRVPIYTTHCPVRRDAMRQVQMQLPHIVVKGPSFQWVLSALNACRTFRRWWSLFDTPTLLLTAEDDVNVSTKAQLRFARRAPAVSLKMLPECYHNVLDESEQWRGVAFEAAVRFLKEAR